MRINGREYRIPELGFGTIKQLEANGISIFDLSNPRKKYMTIISAFAGLAMGLDGEEVDYMIEQHLLGGGNFDGWLEEINKAVENSGFFQALMKKNEKKSSNVRLPKIPLNPENPFKE